MADHHQEPLMPPPATSTPLQQRLGVVPGSLIALAKDTRYVKECQSLFLQVLSFIFPRRRHQLLEQESWILGSLLCFVLGLRHTSKSTTLGMETVGLQFSTNSSRWKLVASTLAAFSWAYAFSPSTYTNRVAGITLGISRSEDSTADNGGSINGLSGGQDFPLRPSSSSSLLSGEETHPNDELLRGQSRREFHELQRQAMLRRSREAAETEASSQSQNTPAVDTTAIQPETVSSPLLQSRPQDITCRLQIKLKMLLFKFAQILASATLSPFDGPHTLPADTHLQNHHNPHQQHQHGVSGEQVGRWIVKLQMAHFCLTGMYPTWMHRFTGHQIVQAPGTSSRLYHQPTTARLVGFLLGAQAIAALIHTSSSVASRWLVLREERRRQSSPNADAKSLATAVVFQTSQSPLPEGSETNGTSSNICSICKMERIQPAAPSSCGHIFCWKCLVHWVSAVRPECPLCRASCRPQDIIALYNYAPTR